MLTPNQIQQIKDIIQARMTFFMANNISPDMLSSEEKKLLKQAGVDVKQINPKDTLVYQSFALGMMSGAIPKTTLNKTSYTQFQNYINSEQFIPLNSYEKGVIRSIESQSLSDIRGLNNRLENFVESTINQQSREHFERTIREELKEGISKKRSLRIISNEISKKMNDFSRDFDRIVQYVSHQSFDEGRSAFIEKNYGEDAIVYKIPKPGACKWCIKAYLTNGLGSKPKVFKLSTLKANGSNIGRKPKDWLPVVGNLHPFDRCTLEFLPDGYEWSEKEKQFVPVKSEQKIDRKSKVKLEFNGKSYEI